MIRVGSNIYAIPEKVLDTFGVCDDWTRTGTLENGDFFQTLGYIMAYSRLEPAHYFRYVDVNSTVVWVRNGIVTDSPKVKRIAKWPLPSIWHLTQLKIRSMKR